jgi:hypothetical protein
MLVHMGVAVSQAALDIALNLQIIAKCKVRSQLSCQEK